MLVQTDSAILVIKSAFLDILYGRCSKLYAVDQSVSFPIAGSGCRQGNSASLISAQLNISYSGYRFKTCLRKQL